MGREAYDEMAAAKYNLSKLTEELEAASAQQRALNAGENVEKLHNISTLVGNCNKNFQILGKHR